MTSAISRFGLSVSHVEYLHCAVRRTCSQSLSVVAQLGIMLKRALRLVNNPSNVVGELVVNNEFLQSCPHGLFL